MMQQPQGTRAPNCDADSSWYDDDTAASRSSYDATASWRCHDATASRNSYDAATSWGCHDATTSRGCHDATTSRNSYDEQPQGTVMKQQTQGFPPQYYQPQTNSQDTSNLIDSEEVAQPQETKVAPPSYS